MRPMNNSLAGVAPIVQTDTRLHDMPTCRTAFASRGDLVLTIFGKPHAPIG